jgi:protein phosphatase-4 regulatory subunit 3
LQGVIKIFYNKYFDTLIDILESSCPPKSIARSIFGSVGVGTRVEEYSAKPEILLHICEFLNFCVVQYPYKIK